jgi:hypothetical protein
VRYNTIERKTLSIRPNWDKSILATHTFANYGKVTVIAGYSNGWCEVARTENETAALQAALSLFHKDETTYLNHF